MRNAIAFALLAFVAGCAGSSSNPSAKPLGDPNHAILVYRFFPGVTSIDNLPTAKDFAVFPTIKRDRSFKVIPGEHSLTAETGAYGRGTYKLRFIFEAGHTYTFDADMSGSKLIIKDEQTGVTVAVRS